MTAETKNELREFAIILFGMISSFISPILLILIALIAISVTDHIFGIWRSKKLKLKISFWFGVKSTFIKIGLYSLVVIASYLIDKAAVNDIITAIAGKQEVSLIFTKAMSLVLMAIEIKSINSNYKEVKGTSLFSAFVSVLKSAKGYAGQVSEIKDEVKNIVSILLVSLLVTSCQIWKHKTSNDVQKEVHTHTDSIYKYYNEKETQTYIKPEKAMFSFLLDSLLKAGVIENKQGVIETKIIYKNNELQVTTSIDSLMKVIKEIQRGQQDFISNQSKKTKKHVQAVKKDTKAGFSPFFVYCLISTIAFLILAFLFFVVKYYGRLK